MDLSIVIVSYNARADLVRCLESLHQHPPALAHEVIVVDNASGDGSADAARGWTGVRVIQNPTNVGFARATNAAIRVSDGEFVLLLNSDTIVPPHALDQLIAHLRRDNDSAIVGPRLVNGEGRVELSYGRMIGPLNELRQRLLVRGHERRLPVVSGIVESMTSRPGFPDWVSGACLLVRRRDAEAVGLLDERYFMYAEDVDFCEAIRSRGRRVRFAPDVTVVHLGGRSVASAPASTATAYRRSQIAFYAKHHPRWTPFLRWYLRRRGLLPDP